MIDAIETLLDFVQSAVEKIDEQLRVRNDEASRVEAANGTRRRVAGVNGAGPRCDPCGIVRFPAP